jgi:carbon storage regulator CsrA
MFVLSRKLNEEIVIDRNIRVRLLKAGRGRVRLGVSAPKETPVQRAELIPGDSPERRRQEASRPLSGHR